MTALSEYQRLEASGLWRATPDEQRSDVIVSIGDATLIITDTRERPLAHWSLAAIQRANPGRRPAIYHPDGDPGETLELPESETEMIAAIERLRAAVERRRPHPGRLRLVMLGLSFLAVAALAVFWFPNAARQHAVRVVPQVKRAEIGAALREQLERVTGPACRDPGGRAALARLSQRLAPTPGDAGQVAVVRDGVASTIHLPGRTILIDKSLVEDHEEPDVVAGYIVAERARLERTDPLDDLLKQAGLWATLRLMTTGGMDEDSLHRYAQHLLTAPRPALPDEALLQAFQTRGVRSTPYAYAQDISGETTLGLIEADPWAVQPPEPLLSDGDWLRLQGICGG
ncbi:hypothetical protein KPG71_04155 [Roseovarius sp. PS-C2]|uniref:hypothetical protein n=1 Tax=Roseovarius sp. PS-C2 TaxID=2820814 RepID=UPI001C0E2CC8|nr:hypothetical protein [Roseovarius sp. PS-C2]MBU3259201.1 hypothetical protein [Roseovarius sp. PS-C2]